LALINTRDFKIKLITSQHKHDYISLNNDGNEDNDNITKSFVLDVSSFDIYCEETVDNLVRPYLCPQIYYILLRVLQAESENNLQPAPS